MLNNKKTLNPTCAIIAYFESVGFTPGQCDLSLAHIISRAVHPASEHATVDWLRENTALCELMGMVAILARPPRSKAL